MQICCLTKWAECDIVTVAAGDISPHAELRCRLLPVWAALRGGLFLWVCLFGCGEGAWVPRMGWRGPRPTDSGKPCQGILCTKLPAKNYAIYLLQDGSWCATLLSENEKPFHHPGAATASPWQPSLNNQSRLRHGRENPQRMVRTLKSKKRDVPPA